jgi:hypothetical protein
MTEVPEKPSTRKSGGIGDETDLTNKFSVRPPFRRFSVVAFVSVLSMASIDLYAQTRLRVELTDQGDCSVTTNSAAGRSHVRYPRQRADWRCAVTAVGGSEAVDLEIVAPPGAGRPAASFPRATWSEEQGRWIGRARLPSPPSVVRIVPSGSSREAWLDVAVLAAAAAAMMWSLAIAGRASRGRRAQGAA